MFNLLGCLDDATSNCGVFYCLITCNANSVRLHKAVTVTQNNLVKKYLPPCIQNVLTS